MLECPKEDCFHWIAPGGAADVSQRVHQSLGESFKKGQWIFFPNGGCSAPGKCCRLNNSNEDWFEPLT